MTLYSRRQLALLIALVVLAGAGLAVGEWRRTHPELSAAIEAFDRRLDDDRPQAAARPSGTAAPPRRAAPAPTTAPPSLPTAERPITPLDLNKATAADLTRLPGVGPVLAARIVASRDTDGPFTSVDDLRRVAGLGPTKLSAVRDHVVVSP